VGTTKATAGVSSFTVAFWVEIESIVATASDLTLLQEAWIRAPKRMAGVRIRVDFIQYTG
jgi:hypothetical protein